MESSSDGTHRLRAGLKLKFQMALALLYNIVLGNTYGQNKSNLDGQIAIVIRKRLTKRWTAPDSEAVESKR